MKNGDLPITPIVMGNGHPYHASQVSFDNDPLVSGLSKREHFAAMAMQGLLSSNAIYGGSTANRATLAKDAIAHADALLKELENVE